MKRRNQTYNHSFKVRNEDNAEVTYNFLNKLFIYVIKVKIFSMLNDREYNKIIHLLFNMTIMSHNWNWFGNVIPLFN